MTVEWSQDLSARLAEMWKVYSSNQIEKILKDEGYAVTRSAVMGRIRRMKLHGKGNRTQTKRVIVSKIDRNINNAGLQVQAINRHKHQILSAEIFEPRSVDVVSLSKPLLDLRAMECRWPDDVQNDDGLHTFCGHRTDGGSYCCAHRQLSIQPKRSHIKMKEAA